MSKKGGVNIILGMGDTPSTEETVQQKNKYEQRQKGGKRKLQRTIKKKSKRKMRKSQRKRK